MVHNLSDPILARRTTKFNKKCIKVEIDVELGTYQSKTPISRSFISDKISKESFPQRNQHL